MNAVKDLGAMRILSNFDRIPKRFFAGRPPALRTSRSRADGPADRRI